MPQPKLAIVCTHPIQYYAPVFRALAESDRIDARVFYTWSQAAATSPPTAENTDDRTQALRRAR